MADFNPSNTPGTCVWCGRKLHRVRFIFERTGKRGAYGDDLFCTLACRAKFGLAAARNGYRFEPLAAPAPAPGELERFASRGVAAQSAVDKLTAPPSFEFGALCDVCGELIAGTKRTRHAACAK